MQNTMVSSYYSKIRSTQNKGVTFLLFGTSTYFSIISPCLDEAKVSTVNTNLKKFIGVQCLHKTIK